ncbi:MAG TPA: hypothetical protein VL306_00465 [Methylomirabilota bacterium]|jgi:hypothetical protein|nr:hypothetical protein [Methylomirabilota bacterium]
MFGRKRREYRKALLKRKIAALQLAIEKLGHSDLLTVEQQADELGILIYVCEEFRQELAILEEK